MTSTTQFRELISVIGSIKGKRAAWLPTLGHFLETEFRLQKEVTEEYKSDVFIDRDEYVLDEGESENRQVAKLFKHVRTKEDADGCLRYGREKFRLIGLQWPTQGGNKEKGRRADLVGIDSQGGLVVFEAKIKSGTHTLSALMEGLDYLACLLREGNFKKIQVGYDKWASKDNQVLSESFKSVKPKVGVRPTLVLLAPQAYYVKQSNTPRGNEWMEIIKHGETWLPSVRVIIAATDFCSSKLLAPELPKSK